MKKLLLTFALTASSVMTLFGLGLAAGEPQSSKCSACVCAHECCKELKCTKCKKGCKACAKECKCKCTKKK